MNLVKISLNTFEPFKEKILIECSSSQLYQYSMRSRRSDDPLSGQCVTAIAVAFQRLISLRHFLDPNDGALLRSSLLGNFLIQPADQKSTFYEIPASFTKSFKFKDFEAAENKNVTLLKTLFFDHFI